MKAPILKQGPFLTASLQAELTDSDLLQLQDSLVEQVGRFRSQGVILDVSALDVMDFLRLEPCAASPRQSNCGAPRRSSWASVPRWRLPWCSWVWTCGFPACKPRWIWKKRL